MLAALLLLAGAAKVDVTPAKLPVIINCGFFERTASKVVAPLYARAIVLGDGRHRIAMAVVDSCMMPRELIDRAKALASEKTGIPPGRMMISATHSHSTPAVMACLGSRAQSDYAEWLPGQIAQAIAQAAARMVPARAGWAVAQDHAHTHCRRFIYRADKMLRDPFGAVSVRANMHPGYENPNAIGPAGPVDPALSLLSIQTLDGKPLALLANYSQHYFGAEAVSPDYYGLFARDIGAKLGAGGDFVGILSQGTSGDQMWMDYSRPKSSITIEQYTREVVDVAYGAYQTIRYRDSLPLAMDEAKLRLRRRVPDAARLAWARDLIARQKGPLPATQSEVYAHEAVMLHNEPERELILQAIRIGDLGIAAIPNEVYALTGLKIKARSPLSATFNIELANGAEGYIPPPEQHRLGGYTTWPARTAGLEVEAEPKITDAILTLLEKVSGKRRRVESPTPADYSRTGKPLAHWRMHDMDDRTGGWEGGVAFYLPGPNGGRSVQFAGGRLRARLPRPVGDYTVSFWVWNGAESGTLLSGGGDLGLREGKLHWNGTAGRTALPAKTWMQVSVIRRGATVRVLLNGDQEISAPSSAEKVAGFVVGDRFEGRMSELAVFAR